MLDRLAREAHKWLLALPSVTAFFDFDQHDLGLILAAAMGLAGYSHLVLFIGKRVGHIDRSIERPVKTEDTCPVPKRGSNPLLAVVS
jgi:hypothetical protein